MLRTGTGRGRVWRDRRESAVINSLERPTRDRAPELLERSEHLAVLTRGLESASHGHGSVVLVGGEAGVGKTALLREFCSNGARAGGRILWGTCERLFTPRALGPFVDIFETAGFATPELDARTWAPHEFASALTAELRAGLPTVLVIEDVHWADESTLDAVKLLARRIEGLPTLAVVSFRDDELTPVDALQVVLGELAGAPGVRRLHLEPLSLGAVRTLASTRGVDGQRLFERTGGNPFFVTEALAATDSEIPETVRGAVLARAAQLDAAARRLLETAAVVPARVELALLESVAGDDLAALDQCLGSGMLRHDDGEIAFRHELARLAVEEAIAPDRRLRLHRSVLAGLIGLCADPARLSYHAQAAGDIGAILSYAPLAGERAAQLCAHREAAEHFARALRHADRLAPDERVRLYERRSYECYLTGQFEEAIEARRAALALHQAAGDPLREGDAHRWLSRLEWFAGHNPVAAAEARQAVALLECQPRSRELAMAYSNEAQLAVLSGDARAAIEVGARAIALAEALGEEETLVHALTNVGTAELGLGRAGGVAKLERSLTLARDGGYEEHVARAYTNLGSGSAQRRDLQTAERYLSAGVGYCQENDLDAWALYMKGWLAYVHLHRGRWDDAADLAVEILRRPRVAVPTRITPLVVIGRVRARHGDPDPWAPLDEALELARGTGELQRLGPVAAARAEAHLLQGHASPVGAETDEAVELARRHSQPSMLGELCAYRRRAGIEDPVAPDSVAPVYALELSGQWREAAAMWNELGFPYEAAGARAESEDEDLLRQALDAFRALGAVPAARAATQRLRRLGATGIARGPRRSTAENPAQLTARQVEILALLAQHMTNAEIGSRLYISPRTVDHHVSAILGKLAVSTRAQAAERALELGVLEK